MDKTKCLTIETNSTSTVEITDLSKSGSFTEHIENVDDKEVTYYKNDIGHYLANVNFDDALKFDILCNPWVPCTSYNFKNDLKSENGRPFRHIWLEENNTWLWYSVIGGVKGAFCRVCVLFKPNVHRGIQGGFIIKPFTKYKVKRCVSSDGGYKGGGGSKKDKGSLYPPLVSRSTKSQRAY